MTIPTTPAHSDHVGKCQREVLVVEDEAVTALHIRQLLESLGYCVSGIAASGEQAISLLEQHRPDLVLMDITLAGELSGTETARIVWDRFRTPVVYLTAHTDGATLQDIGAAGEHGFLTKPLRAQDLAPVLQLAISRHLRHLQSEDERIAWEDLCRQSREQLEQFTYRAGHDLKEPLRTARTFVDLLGRRLSSTLGTEEQKLLDQVQAALTRMNALTDDLLEYAQAGVAAGAPVPETPADTALSWALQNLRSAIGESGARISCDPLPVVRAEPSQLAQVFQNLVANAIKYRRTDQVPQIHIAVAPREREWIFSISDNGIGFKQEHAARIFQPFRRLHSQHEYPGTGIGLAICSKIVETHGGRIWAESSPGNGSIFRFTLPNHEGAF